MERFVQLGSKNTVIHKQSAIAESSNSLTANNCLSVINKNPFPTLYILSMTHRHTET